MDALDSLAGSSDADFSVAGLSLCKASVFIESDKGT